MLMADTMAIFFVVVGLLVSFVGLWLLGRGLWPNRVLAAAERVERGLLVPFFVGLPVTVVAVVVSLVATALPGKAGGVTAVVVLCVFLMFSHAGVSGLATAIGRRLGSPVDDASPWRATTRGSVVLALAYLAPVIGWFAILPISTVVGAGAATLALMPRRRAVTAPLRSPFETHAADAARG